MASETCYDMLETLARRCDDFRSGRGFLVAYSWLKRKPIRKSGAVPRYMQVAEILEENDEAFIFLRRIHSIDGRPVALEGPISPSISARASR
jgi:hypothetical protein